MGFLVTQLQTPHLIIPYLCVGESFNYVLVTLIYSVKNSTKLRVVQKSLKLFLYIQSLFFLCDTSDEKTAWLGSKY